MKMGSFYERSVFYEELEKCIVEDCGKYYSVISKDWMNDSVPEYLLKVAVFYLFIV
jgi:hypothetical protein